jgi:hypothetical protein
LNHEHSNCTLELVLIPSDSKAPSTNNAATFELYLPLVAACLIDIPLSDAFFKKRDDLFAESPLREARGESPQQSKPDPHKQIRTGQMTKRILRELCFVLPQMGKLGGESSRHLDLQIHKEVFQEHTRFQLNVLKDPWHSHGAMRGR